MQQYWVAMTAIVFLLCAGPARAADEDPYSRSGWFAGAGVGVGLGSLPETPGTSAAVEFGLLGGYRISPHIALEGQVYHVHHLDYDKAPYGNASFWTILGDIRVYLPMGRVQPFLLTGIGPRIAILREAGDSDESDTKTDGTVVLGAGIEYYLSKHILMSLDGKYNWGFDRGMALDYGTIGLRGVYRF